MKTKEWGGGGCVAALRPLDFIEPDSDRLSPIQEPVGRWLSLPLAGINGRAVDDGLVSIRPPFTKSLPADFDGCARRVVALHAQPNVATPYPFGAHHIAQTGIVL